MDLLHPRYRWIMLLTTMLPLFQQLSGINTCILYSSEVRTCQQRSYRLLAYLQPLMSDEMCNSNFYSPPPSRPSPPSSPLPG